MSSEIFFDAYVECALWSSTDESTSGGGNPMDNNYGPEDIAPKTLAKMQEDCDDFIKLCGDLLETIDDEHGGHDFWLTRNGHGAGFWDRGLGELGDKLTAHAKSFSTFCLYVGDDGMIYGS